MGDIDRGGAGRAVDAHKFAAHLDPELGVEVRQRFVEEKDCRLRRERPGDGDALLLAARDLGRIAVAQGGNAEQRQNLSDPRLARRTIPARSEEHTSELQSLMRISYAVFCLKKKKTNSTK